MRNIIIILFAILSLNSCIEEPITGELEEGEVSVRFSLTSKSPAQTNQEKAIELVRIIVIHGGVIRFNKMVLGTSDNQYIARADYGVSDFYVICNETPEMSEKIRAITSASELEAITFAAPLTSPFAMYGKISGLVRKSGENIVIDYGGKIGEIELSVGVERIVAKVSLSFIKNSPLINKVSNIKISVHQKPEYSFIGTHLAYPSSAHWLPVDQSITVAPDSPYSELTINSIYKINTTKDGFDITGEHIDMVDFYIPENILANAKSKQRNTYIEITADCQLSDRTVISKWRIDLEKEDNFGVIRNHHYKILATIEGLGPMSLYADIIPVTEHNIIVGWGFVNGLVIVSDKTSEYNQNTNVWNDYDALTGILKVFYDPDNDGGGVFEEAVFKYGSTIAVKAGESFNATTSILYKPSTFTSSISTYQDVPYLNNGAIGVNNAANVAAGVGDPCRLVGLSTDQIQKGAFDNNQWRMMTEQEMGRLIIANDSRDPDITSFSADGYKAYHTLLIPNTKELDENGAAMSPLSYTGAYWISESNKAFLFKANSQQPYLGTSQQIASHNRQRSVSIRCVRTSIPESLTPVIKTTNPNRITYRGNTVGEPFTVTTNIPYWTAQVTKLNYVTPDDSETILSTFTDPSYFPHFSFENNHSPNKIEISGKGTETKHVFFSRDEANDRRSIYYITVKGYGYDGNWLEVTSIARQHEYVWIPTIESTSGSAIFTGRTAIIKDGEISTVKIIISPQDVAIPTDRTYYLTLKALNESNNTVSTVNTVPIDPSTRTYLVPITIGSNPGPNARTLKIEASTDLPRQKNHVFNIIQLYE